MHHRRIITVAASWLLGLSLLVAPALAADPVAPKPATPATPAPPAAPAAAGKKQIDPKAEDVLRKLAESYKGMKSVRANMKMNMKMDMQGFKQEMPAEYAFAVQRPNKVAMRLKDGMGATMVSDGEKLFVHIPMVNQYQEVEAPKNFEGVSNAGGNNVGNDFLMGGLFSEQPYEKMLDGVDKAAYVGMEKDGAKELHRLRMSQEDFSWDMWIEAGAKPLLSKMEIDLSKAMAANLPEEAKNVSMIMTMSFTGWDLDPKFAADEFKFTPPAGAQKTDKLSPGAEGEAEEDKASALIGKVAPQFKLDLLDGKKMDLAQHKGKEVVILDFWATWCGPCVRAMPVLTEVAESYKSKGVVLYAVNQQEDNKTIDAFLKKQKLAVTVALDKDGAVAEKYGVEGIPQTVIIDKNGNVAAVHVGFSPNLKEILQKDLDPLTK